MNPDFEQIKRTTDIVRVVESYGIVLKKSGVDYVGLCPFHEDATPSLRVTQEKGLFRCPSCGATGNVIQFVAKKESLTEREAALKLCGTIPGVTRASTLLPEPKEPELDAGTRARLLGRVVSFYAKILHKDRAGMEYLKSRRLDNPAMLEILQVGYCNGTMRNLLPKAGEIVEQLKTLGVLNDKGNECFYGRVVVPIFDVEGNVCGLYGRRLNNEEPRHLYLKGERRGVFNGIAAKTQQTLIITEAIFDAMSLYQAGFCNGIALYGKDGWTAAHETLIRENGVTEIVLALDNDERGQEATTKLEARLAALGLPLRVNRVKWTDGVKDANDFFLSHSAENFLELLPQSLKEAEETAREEKTTFTADGFTLTMSGRRYELCAMEKPSAGRLKATVKAVADESGSFHIDTVDFYLSRSRKAFVAEAARLFRETPETIEADTNRMTEAVEKYLTQKLEGKGVAVVTVPDADRMEAARMGRSAGMMDELQRDFGKLGIIGEEPNRLLLYLGMTSRKMEDPLAVQILSSSGAGKSHLQDAVLSLCPDEDLIKLTSLTGQALFYKGEESLRHKCLAIAEVAGAEGARYAMRNLISDKKLVIESTVKNSLTGRLETQLNTVYGPVAVFETTTKPDTDPETKSRYILLSVDESAEQTRAILHAQRNSHTLDAMRLRRQREAVLKKHHALQRLLEPVTVINPYEPLLSYGEKGGGAGRLAFRRDHPKYLNLILAVTFLHQMQRPRKHDIGMGEDYIETTLDDIAIANELAHSLFGQSLDDISIPSRDLLRLIGDYAAGRAAAEKKAAEEVEWTRRELRESIQWTEARLRTHLGELIQLEYVGVKSGRFGQRFIHRLLVNPDEIETGGRFVAGLKSVEQLQKEANLAGLNPNLAGQKENLAGTSQVSICEVLPTANPHEHNGNGQNGANLAGETNGRIYVLKKVELHTRKA